MSRPDRAVFRLPASALFLPVLLLFCITPLATAGGAWAVLFVVPAIAMVWVLITRTTASTERLTAHGLLGSHAMAWSDMDGLEFKDSRWAVAVAHDGRRLRLPMVRPRDLPRLASVSGGSLNLGEKAVDHPDDAAAGEPREATPDAAADPINNAPENDEGSTAKAARDAAIDTAMDPAEPRH